jgi:hypothetical protein
MATRNGIHAADAAVSAQLPSVGREPLSVDGIGRLALHCADGAAPLGAVSTFLTLARPNIVAADQSSTGRRREMLLQRSGFRLQRRSTEGYRAALHNRGRPPLNTPAVVQTLAAAMCSDHSTRPLLGN